MKALLGLLLLTLTTTAHACEVPCEFLNAEGKPIGHALAVGDSEAAAEIFSAASALVVLDDKLYVKEGFTLDRALEGKLEPVQKIRCYLE
jgi:hypothetical protein